MKKVYPVVKLLVQVEAGYKLWGSRPAALEGVEKGQTVSFEAKVQPSNNDPKFGFYSRPTKAEIVN